MSPRASLIWSWGDLRCREALADQPPTVVRASGRLTGQDHVHSACPASSASSPVPGTLQGLMTVRILLAVVPVHFLHPGAV